jgi:hypothetical protein
MKRDVRFTYANRRGQTVLYRAAALDHPNQDADESNHQ